MLPKLNLTNCRQLNDIGVTGNKFTELDLSGFEHLTTVSCVDSPTLRSLNLSNCPNLTTVYVESNDILASLDLSNCGNLDFVQCPGNQLTTLKLAGAYYITYLNCRNNKLTSLDLTGCGLAWYSDGQLSFYSNPGDGVSKFPVKDSDRITNDNLPEGFVTLTQWEYEDKTIYADFQVVE